METKNLVQKVLITIIFVCLIQCSTAIFAGEKYDILHINKCFGLTTVKIRGVNSFWDGEYNVVGFEKIGRERRYDIWTYNCDNKDGEALNVLIETANNVSNTYYVMLEYYIAPYNNSAKMDEYGPNNALMQNDDNKRTKTFTNLEFEPKPKIKIPFKFNLLSLSNNGNSLVLIIIGIVLVSVIGGGVYLIYRIFFKGKDEVVSESTLSGSGVEPTDEEVLEFIRRNTR